MKIPTEPYTNQVARWPGKGRHILAHYDADSIVVYQAYRPSIGMYAIEHGLFGGEFSYSRMSWIKPNFLWMMYRSAWGTKPGQEITLALRLRRVFFDEALAQAVQCSYDDRQYATCEEWKAALAKSSVRLQWDPDHDPHGAKLERRAIQLGMRGSVLEAFGERELLEIIDMNDFVTAQRSNVSAPGLAGLETPVERVYVPQDAAVCKRLGLERTGSPTNGCT